MVSGLYIQPLYECLQQLLLKNNFIKKLLFFIDESNFFSMCLLGNENLKNKNATIQGTA